MRVCIVCVSVRACAQSCVCVCSTVWARVSENFIVFKASALEGLSKSGFLRLEKGLSSLHLDTGKHTDPGPGEPLIGLKEIRLREHQA